MPDNDDSIPASCRGERCSVCGDLARHKVQEEILHDDPQPIRHGLSAYLCTDHFNVIMFGRGRTVL